MVWWKEIKKRSGEGRTWYIVGKAGKKGEVQGDEMERREREKIYSSLDNREDDS